MLCAPHRHQRSQCHTKKSDSLPHIQTDSHFFFFFFFILFPLLCGVNVRWHVRLHVAWSYTSSADSPFSLISSFTLSNHLLLGLPPFLLPCTFITIALLPNKLTLTTTPFFQSTEPMFLTYSRHHQWLVTHQKNNAFLIYIQIEVIATMRDQWHYEWKNILSRRLLV